MRGSFTRSGTHHQQLGQWRGIGSISYVPIMSPGRSHSLRKLARYLDRPRHAAAETPGRRGHSDSVYADIAEFTEQAHRDRHRTVLSVVQRSQRKRNIHLRSRTSGAPAHVRSATFKQRLASMPKPREDTTR